jgi:hypothetical protein
MERRNRERLFGHDLSPPQLFKNSLNLLRATASAQTAHDLLGRPAIAQRQDIPRRIVNLKKVPPEDVKEDTPLVGLKDVTFVFEEVLLHLPSPRTTNGLQRQRPVKWTAP